MQRDISYDFRAVSRPCRIHSGANALDRLGEELKRAGVSRALVITGRSIAEGTDLPQRLSDSADGRIAGVFAGMSKDTPLDDVLAATERARELGADGLIALGGGSVIQGARVTSIFLAEEGSPEQLATQYPEDGPAISPRLMAEKLPIVNVPTIGTTAQDRGGSPVQAPALGRRLEYFDPKTRPAALFWDRAALATAPEGMLRATAAMIWWRAVLDMGYTRATILADLNRREVLAISDRLRRALAAGDTGDAVRADLCVATWLQNRAADDGARAVNTWVSRVSYAFAVALFHTHGHLSQGAATAAVGPTVMRALGPRDPRALEGMADALGLPAQGPAKTAEALADRMADDFAALGHATDFSALDIPRDSAPVMLENALSNFNADPNREFARERGALSKVLESCW